jgi:hypothetical protein
MYKYSMINTFEMSLPWIINAFFKNMYTRKNAQVVAKQTCSNAVPTTCQCVRTACAQHVDNKPLTTTCYKVIELKRLTTSSSNNLFRPAIGLLHLIPVPLLSRTSFSKGEISHFFQRGNWEKWKKNALSRGVKKQKCTSRGGSSLFQRDQLHRFFCIPEG